MRTNIALSTSRHWYFSVSTSGIFATAPRVRRAANAGDSSTVSRTNRPMPMSTIEAMNGQRQPPARKPGPEKK